MDLRRLPFIPFIPASPIDDQPPDDLFTFPSRDSFSRHPRRCGPNVRHALSELPFLSAAYPAEFYLLFF